MMKIGFVVIATLMLRLFSEISPALSQNGSNGEFSSFLETVVGGPITPPFRINGGNGYCGYSCYAVTFILYPCNSSDGAERYVLYSDGSIRLPYFNYNKCLTARGLTQGSKVEYDDCNKSNQQAINWQMTPRQILHSASGLALTAMYGTSNAEFTLEENVFSSYQTFRFDYNKPVPTARITGMNDLCLVTSNNKVWIEACGSSVSEKWLIYPDGTIRPQQRSDGCLSFDNSKNSTVLVMSCGLASSTGRWILTQNGMLLNERFNLALDVTASDSSLRKIVAYRPTGSANQLWKILYV